MRLLAIPLLLLAVVLAQAEEGALSGPEIRTLLPGSVAQSKTTRQTFAENGDTAFDDGRRVSNGRLRVQEDFYCSLWPPGGGWRCYRVLVDEKAGGPDLIVWIDAENGERAINTILPKGR